MLSAGAGMMDPRGTYGQFGAGFNRGIGQGVATYLPFAQFNVAQQANQKQQEAKKAEADINQIRQQQYLSQFNMGVPAGQDPRQFYSKVLWQAPDKQSFEQAKAILDARYPAPQAPPQAPWGVTPEGGMTPQAEQYYKLTHPQQSVNVNTGPQWPEWVEKGYMPKDPANPALGQVPIPGGSKDPAAKQALDLPKVEEDTNYTLDLVKSLKDHPGKSYAVGKSSVLPIVPGTSAADFMTRYDQLKGKQFLQAYQQLKGGGTITEVEGAKAEAAMARLDRAQTEKEFDSALDEFSTILQTGLERARKMAGKSPKAETPTSGSIMREEKVINGTTYFKQNGQWYQK